MENKFQINIPPVWSEISQLRVKVSNFIVALGFHEEVAQNIGMIISELAENAVKYGKHADDSTPDIRVEVDATTDRIRVAVRCPVQTGRHLQRFEETMNWIQTFDDPFMAYVEKMRDVAQQDPSLEESGLGLVRIEYEGRAELAYELNGEMLTVSAVYRLPAGAVAE